VPLVAWCKGRRFVAIVGRIIMAKLFVPSDDHIPCPPARDATDGRNCSLVHNPQKRFALRPRRRPVDRRHWAVFVESNHPVPKRLMIHACLLPRGIEAATTNNRRAPRHILCSPRKPSNCGGCAVRPNCRRLPVPKLISLKITKHCDTILRNQNTVSLY
jgi:hypothetical protein